MHASAIECNNNNNNNYRNYRQKKTYTEAKCVHQMRHTQTKKHDDQRIQGLVESIHTFTKLKKKNAHYIFRSLFGISVVQALNISTCWRSLCFICERRKWFYECIGLNGFCASPVHKL